jgi:hypothetical protein
VSNTDFDPDAYLSGGESADATDNAPAQSDTFDPDAYLGSPAQAAPAEPAHPAGFDPDAYLRGDHEQPESSAGGAFARGFAKSVAPTIGSLPAIGAGAEAGGTLGAVAGPVGAVAGGIAGGFAGAIGAGYLISKAQDWVLDKLGLSNAPQDQADATQHPYAQEAGSLAAGMLAFGGGAARGVQRLAGAAIFGGQEAGQELYNEGKVDPTKVALAAGAGAVAPNPRAYAEKMMGLGTAAARRFVPGRPDVKVDPDAVADKETVDNANDQPIVAKGVATEQPPPNADVNVGIDNKPERSERQYGKGKTATQGGIETAPTQRGMNTDLLTPDQIAALQNSLDQTNVANQRIEPEKSNMPGPGEPQAPVVTGLDKLRPPQAEGEAQPAPQAEQQHPVAPVPETAPAAQYPHPEIEGLNISRGNPVRGGGARFDKKANTVFIDKSVPPSIDVAGKKIDPAVPMAVREVAFRSALDHAMSAPAGQRLPIEQRRVAAIDVAKDVEKHWLESRGFDYNAYRDALSGAPADQVRTTAADVPAEPAVQERPSGDDASRPAPDQSPAATEELSAKAGPEQLQPTAASSAFDKLKAAAPEVTATVTRPKVVDAALAAMEASAKRNPQARMVRDALANEPDPNKQALLARKVLEQVQGRGGRAAATRAVKDNPEVQYATARIPSKPPEVEGLGVTARDKADAARKVGAIKAADSAFQKFAPPDDTMPTSKAQKEALKQRLLSAIQHANMENGGKDPITTYKPSKTQPPGWQWLKAAQKLAQSRMTQKQIAEFITAEKLLRSGKAEDASMVRQGNRIESDIAMSRAPTTEQADLAGAFRDREFPGEVVPAEDVEGTERPATAEDINPPADKTLDLTKMTPAEVETLQAQTDKVTRNLIDMDNKQRAKQREAEAVAERTGKLKRAREAVALTERQPLPPVKESEGAASPGRRLEITDELRKQAMENWAKSEAKEKSRYYTPDGTPVETKAPPTKAADEVTPQVPKLEQLATEFLNNHDGSLNIAKVQEDVKAKFASARLGAKKYFGVPDGDVAHKADTTLAQGMFEKARLDAQVIHRTDADWHVWAKQKMDDVFKFLKVYEEGPDLDRNMFEQRIVGEGIDAKTAGWMAASREMMRDLYDQMFKFEEGFGSKAEYRAGYIRHVFKDEAGVQKWIDDHIVPTLGSSGFQQERVFDTIEQAVNAGFKLKYDNPIDVLNARWKMGVNSSLITGMLRRLRQDGIAYQVAAENNPGGKIPVNIRDWQKYSNLMDGTQWAIHPDAQALWTNAVEARGLAELHNPIGSVFRGWMQVKTVWAPIQLALSAFHAVHVMGINAAQNVSTAIRTASKTGEWAKEMKTAGKLTMDQTVFAWPVDKIKIGGIGAKLDALSGNRFSQAEGRKVMDYWHLPESQMTPDQRMTVGLLREMGVVPENSRQEVIGAKRQLELAVAKNQYFKQLPIRVRRAIEIIQAPLFNRFIPQLKVEAAKNAAAAALRTDPELLTNYTKRQQVLRAIGQDIHDRYGEMFYDGMFWNRYVKDIGIGSMLSLSWNIGQARQLTGAVRSAFDTAKGVAGLPPSGNRMALTRRAASDKGTFVATYVALSMGMTGLMSWGLSGQFPTGLDWVFARNGMNNPDGSAARLSNPFNTREPSMLVGHAQEHGNLVGGMMAFLWNKMILSPVTEAWNNQDFFGRELYDPNAPWYKRAVQLVDSTLGNHLSPITLSGSDRVAAAGGGTGMKALSYAGFGPAPKYVSNDAWQNRINELYFTHLGGRPYEYGKKTGLGRGMFQGAIRALAGDKLQSEQMQEGRQHLSQGYATKNDDLMRQGRQEMVKAGVSPRYVGSFRPNQEFQFKFAQLPIPVQQGLYKIMPKEQQDYYVRMNPTKGMSPARKFKIMNP